MRRVDGRRGHLGLGGILWNMRKMERERGNPNGMS